MPLSAGDRQAVLTDIEALLKADVLEEFSKEFGIATALAHKIPDQLNNECRNALVHLARAVAVDTKAEADNEIGKARNHIERAKRDALKIAISEVEERIRIAMMELDIRRSAVPLELLAQRKVLAQDYAKVRTAESQGKPTVVDDMTELFQQAYALYEKVTDLLKVPEPHAKRFRKTRVMMVKFGMRLKQVATGVLIAIVLGAIFAIVIPDETAFGMNVRKWIAENILGLKTAPAAAQDAEADDTQQTR